MTIFELVTDGGLHTWYPVFVYALLAGMLGTGAKKLVKRYLNDPDWFMMTLPWQAVAAAIFFAEIGHRAGVPVHPAFGESYGGALMQGALAGILSVFFYDALVDRIQYMLRRKREQRASVVS